MREKLKLHNESKSNDNITVVRVKLFEASADKYPIFDYNDIKGSNFTMKVGKHSSFCHRKDCETKLSCQIVGKEKQRKRHIVVDDFIDKGEGYIQDDDFIDDSQAYDEWIPSYMDTEKGGHYVNMGPVFFKHTYLPDEISGSEGGSKFPSKNVIERKLNEEFPLVSLKKMTNNLSNSPRTKMEKHSGTIRLSSTAAPPTKK